MWPIITSCAHGVASMRRRSGPGSARRKKPVTWRSSRRGRNPEPRIHDESRRTVIYRDAYYAEPRTSVTIALGGHREPGLKIKVLDYFDFNLSRCSFCGLCAEVCPTKPIKALIMSEDYELGSYSRDKQILRVDEMYDGVEIEQYTH